MRQQTKKIFDIEGDPDSDVHNQRSTVNQRRSGLIKELEQYIDDISSVENLWEKSQFLSERIDSGQNNKNRQNQTTTNLINKIYQQAIKENLPKSQIAIFCILADQPQLIAKLKFFNPYLRPQTQSSYWIFFEKFRKMNPDQRIGCIFEVQSLFKQLKHEILFQNDDQKAVKTMPFSLIVMFLITYHMFRE